MTTPAEQANAVKRARALLDDLIANGPDVVFRPAMDILRHYPADFVVDEKWAADIEEYERGLKELQP